MRAGDQRVAARMALGVIAAILCLLLMLAGASVGLTGSVAFSQPSPSGSPSGSPDGGASGEIFLLNPSKAYDPHADTQEPPQPDPSTDDPSASADRPKISDKPNGQGEGYHVVAVVKDPPPTALVEAYWKLGTSNEVTVGELTPVPGRPDTYEFFWDIPSNMSAGFGVFTVRLYTQTPSGFEQTSEDSVEAILQHRAVIYLGGGPTSPSDTVELTWPLQGGPLGFYKGANAGAKWKTVVSGTASAESAAVPANDPGSNGTGQVRGFYSTTPIGKDPEFTFCGQGNTSGGGPGGSRTFKFDCGLEGTDKPSQVTAFAAVALENQDDSGEGEAIYTQEAADAHRVVPYMQRVEDMTIELGTFTNAQQTVRRHVVAGSACTAYIVSVTDLLDRPVEGANVDIHLRGPNDQATFGDETRTGAVQSGKQKPQKGHSTESSTACNNTATLRNEQGDHNVPGAPDIKHIESTLGTGESGGSGVSFGQWEFVVYSASVGEMDLTAWIDDEPVATDAEKRVADDDLPETTEITTTNFVQWLPSAPAVTIDPQGATAAAGTCQRFVIRVRGGTRPVKGANVDVHATGPDDGLDFCDPSDASQRRAPETGTGHNPEDAGEATHTGQPPVAQHTEGETNDQGNFIVGITSPVPGDTTLTAWYDAGEAPHDNDDFTSGEPTASATTNWVASTGDAAVSFLNPSPYGNAGPNVAKTRDVDAGYHIVTRVSSIEPVAGVEIFYRSGTNPLVKIGDAVRVNETDAWEVFWAVDVPDGSYTLVARIRDTAITAEQAITVRNEDPVDPRVGPLETVEISSPLNGQRATFVRSKLPVRGVASAGANGVTLYYTKAGSITTPAAGAWTQCGTTTLPGGSAPQEFTLDCALAGSDQPSMVTGVAALAYNCFENRCDVNKSNDSGDAHRVFGAEANPVLSIEPAETAANTGVCQKFVVMVQDQTGQPVSGQNLDAHITGPGTAGGFCSPADGSATVRRSPDQGTHSPDGEEAYHEEGSARTYHTEGETTGNGRFVVGIESDAAEDAQLTAWLDANDDDLQGQDEVSDISIMHWEAEGVCDITGTNGPDTLTGTDAPEKICGFGGDDTITGGGGNDTITGGAGADLLRGNAANDSVRGGAGNDRVFGGGGSDRLSGGGDNDVVNGHRGNDRLRGNAGRDRLNGGSGRDDCGGGRGRDRMRRCETGTRSIARPRLI